jgi:hypothetical protein
MSGRPKRSEETKEQNLTIQEWLMNLYSLVLISDQDLKGWYDIISYQGFDRNRVIEELKNKIPDQLLVVKIIILIALRGPKRASIIQLPNNKTLVEMGIPSSGGKGTRTLTCNKISAATADLAAYYLKKMNVPKRLDGPLPGWLQFPAAGSIRMPKEFREQHREFSKKFSIQLKGSFNEQIYDQMERNCYIEESLKLFD